MTQPGRSTGSPPGGPARERTLHVDGRLQLSCDRSGATERFDLALQTLNDGTWVVDVLADSLAAAGRSASAFWSRRRSLHDVLQRTATPIQIRSDGRPIATLRPGRSLIGRLVGLPGVRVQVHDRRAVARLAAGWLRQRPPS